MFDERTVLQKLCQYLDLAGGGMQSTLSSSLPHPYRRSLDAAWSLQAIVVEEESSMATSTAMIIEGAGFPGVHEVPPSIGNGDEWFSMTAMHKRLNSVFLDDCTDPAPLELCFPVAKSLNAHQVIELGIEPVAAPCALVTGEESFRSWFSRQVFLLDLAPGGQALLVSWPAAETLHEFADSPVVSIDLDLREANPFTEEDKQSLRRVEPEAQWRWFANEFIHYVCSPTVCEDSREPILIVEDHEDMPILCLGNVSDIMR